MTPYKHYLTTFAWLNRLTMLWSHLSKCNHNQVNFILWTHIYFARLIVCLYIYMLVSFVVNNIKIIRPKRTNLFSISQLTDPQWQTDHPARTHSLPTWYSQFLSRLCSAKSSPLRGCRTQTVVLKIILFLSIPTSKAWLWRNRQHALV